MIEVPAFRAIVMGEIGSDRYRLSGWSVSQSRLQPTHRYEVDLSHGKSVADIGDGERSILYPDLVSAHQAVIDDVLENHADRGPFQRAPVATDTLPEGFIDLLDEYDYIVCDRDGTRLAIPFEVFANDCDRSPLLRFDAARIRDRIGPDEPAIVEFSVRNVGSEPIEFATTAPWPFGVPMAMKTPNDPAELARWDFEERTFPISTAVVRLWNDEFEDRYGVSFGEFPNLSIPRKETRTVEPTESVRREYALSASSDLVPGEYVIPVSFMYEPSDCRREAVGCEIEFTVSTG